MKPPQYLKLFNRQNFLLIILVVISVFAFFVPYFKLDLLISKELQGINSVLFQNIMWFVTDIGNQPTMVIIVAVTGVVLYIFRQRTEAVIGTLAAAGSALSGSLLKIIVNRPRPDAGLIHVSVWLSDKSYPSNHVLVFTVFFGFLLYLLLRQPKHKPKGIILSVLFILLITLIGISRIYLGAHWASDVLGGYLLGIIWLIFTIRLYNSYHGKR
jgi:membrane-associated phospholipid phosphatase